jgi:hypothetical protein
MFPHVRNTDLQSLSEKARSQCQGRPRNGKLWRQAEGALSRFQVPDPHLSVPKFVNKHLTAGPSVLDMPEICVIRRK